MAGGQISIGATLGAVGRGRERKQHQREQQTAGLRLTGNWRGGHLNCLSRDRKGSSLSKYIEQIRIATL